MSASDETKPLNLIQKLALIRREMDHVEKKGENTHFGYSYMRAEDVAGDIGDRFAALNIVIGRENGRTEVHALSKGFMVVVECTYLLIDGDSGERLPVWSCGAGYDSGDKGIYKAETGALKYALTQALCMRVGDDAEADGDDPPPPKNGHVDHAGGRQNGQGADASLIKTTRISLIRKAKDRLGEEGGMKWLSVATKELGKTSETLTVAEMLALSERVSKLTPPDEGGQQAEHEDDIPF